MTIEKFFPQSPDPNLNVGPDMTLARFGHLNKLVDDINAGGGGGGGGIIDNSEGLLTSARIGVDNVAYGDYGSALTGFNNLTCNDFTASTWGRQSCAIGCYSSVNGTSNIVVARNSHILSGTNNTIACDATQGAWSTQSSYSSNYIDNITLPDGGGIACGRIGQLTCDLTSMWNAGDTFSATYVYASGVTGTGSAYSQIQMVNVSVICSEYVFPSTYLYFCYDPTSPSFVGTYRCEFGTGSTESYGYLQKTGTFSSYSTYGATYHPNTIAGGAFNVINGYTSGGTISGGYQNTMSNGYGTISGGYYNYMDSGGFIGGSSNVQKGSKAIQLGWDTCSEQSYTAVNMGRSNCIYNSMSASTIGSGARICSSACASIFGGDSNHIRNSSIFSSIISSNNSCIDNSSYSIVIGGNNSCVVNLSNTHIIGNNIIADQQGALHVNKLSIKTIPTASAGLPSGSVWSNAGVLTIVP